VFLSHVNNGRRRRVRLAYPQALVDLVLALLPTCGVASVARVADIPESVIYRWRTLRYDGDRSMEELLDRCVDLSPQYAKLIELTRQAVSQNATSDAGRADALIRPRPTIKEILLEDVQRSSDATPAEESSISINDDAKRRLHLAKSYIEDHYNETLSCAVLGRVAGMSRNYFIRLFGEEFGVTPHQYLMRTRLKAASQLLANSEESIDVIAAGVGFRSGANLGRAFKRIGGRNISQMHTFTAVAPSAFSQTPSA
jgi:AraC-like DNA-binding protein